MTSRNSQVTFSFESGPGLISWMRRSTCALAFRAVDETGLAMARLDLADLLRATGALVQEFEQLSINAVDLVADDAQFLLQIAHALRFRKSFMNSTSARTPPVGMAL